MTLPTLQTAFNADQIATLQQWIENQVDLLISDKVSKYDSSNAATGATSVTINATSGIATFTQVLVDGAEPQKFRIINSNWSAVSANTFKVNLEMQYPFDAGGFPYILSYGFENTALWITLSVVSGFGDTDSPVKIKFQLS